LGVYAGLTAVEAAEALESGSRYARQAAGPASGPLDEQRAEAWAWLAATLADRPGLADAHAAEWQPIAERLVREAESAGFAVGHRLLGRLYGCRAALAGGNLNQSRTHFERALTLAPSPLTAFEMARTWAVEAQDAARFQSLIEGILAADGPEELAPETHALRERAERLLRRKRELFGDPAAGLP
jgi:hypothetical protein